MWECSVCNAVYRDDDSILFRSHSLTPIKIEAGVFMCQGCAANAIDSTYDRLREEGYKGDNK